MKGLLTNINLRVDRRYKKNVTNLDYTLSGSIAKEQLAYEADIYWNCESMECMDEDYLYEFSKAGFKRITAWFGNDNRGLMCYVRKDYKVRIVRKMENPHFLHMKIEAEGVEYDSIICRILVSNGDEYDYIDRKAQWDVVMDYIDQLQDKSHLIMVGDWNHGYIRNAYQLGSHSQYYFSYQYIKDELAKRNISMGMNLAQGHKEHSYLGYLAIDHIAIGEGLVFEGKPSYSEYDAKAPIGTPDHAYLQVEWKEK